MLLRDLSKLLEGPAPDELVLRGVAFTPSTYAPSTRILIIHDHTIILHALATRESLFSQGQFYFHELWQSTMCIRERNEDPEDLRQGAKIVEVGDDVYEGTDALTYVLFTHPHCCCHSRIPFGDDGL
eukprot:288077-Amorphochlora_amoeboformis.AAC.1